MEAYVNTNKGYMVVMIREVNGNTLIDYIPEWTPVRNYSSFHYGTKKFRVIVKYNHFYLGLQLVNHINHKMIF